MKQFYTRPYPETPADTPAAATADMGRVALDPDGIPDYFKIRPQFVGWNAKPKSNGKLDKVPMIAGTTRNASSTDLLTWRPFEEAYAAYEDGKHDGVGFVFCSGDPFVGVDLDKCRNPETGDIELWAREILESFEAPIHVEVSPSGTGIHIITQGVCKDGVNTKRVEVYGQDRFFTMTGVTP